MLSVYIRIGNQAIPTTAYARVLGWHLRQATQHHEERGSQKQPPYGAGWCGFGLVAGAAQVPECFGAPGGDAAGAPSRKQSK